MARRNWRFANDDKNLAAPGTEDDVFRDAADGMIAAMRASNNKRLTKLYVAEILYRGRRHEVWLNKSQIRYRSRDQLAGYIKKKCMEG